MEELVGAQIKKNHFEVLNAVFKVTVCTVKSCQSIPQYTRQRYCSQGGDIVTLSTSVRVFKKKKKKTSSKMMSNREAV